MQEQKNKGHCLGSRGLGIVGANNKTRMDTRIEEIMASNADLKTKKTSSSSQAA